MCASTAHKLKQLGQWRPHPVSGRAGHAFLPPQQINGRDDLWWYQGDGGAIGPGGGDRYFSENGRSPARPGGPGPMAGHVNGPPTVMACSGFVLPGPLLLPA